MAPRGGACVWLTGWAYQHREAPLFVPSTQKMDVALGILVNAQSPRTCFPDEEALRRLVPSAAQHNTLPANEITL